MILVYLILLVACLVLAVSSLVSSARGWRPSIEPRASELLAGWAAFIAAVAISGWLIFAPLMSSRSTIIGAGGATETIEHRLTLLQAGQMTLLPILALVIAITVAPLVLRRRRSRYWLEVVGGLLLAAFSLLAGFSIGLFLLPIAALMWVAAMLGRAANGTA